MRFKPKLVGIGVMCVTHKCSDMLETALESDVSQIEGAWLVKKIKKGYFTKLFYPFVNEKLRVI